MDHPQMASARRVEGKGVGAIKPASLFNTSEEYVYTQAAVGALRSLASEPDHAPFALTLSLHSPHGPPETFEQFISAYPLLLDWMSGSEKVAGVTMEEIGTALYHAQVSQSDFLFGLLLEALGELKLRQSTLVLFFSDHGARHTCRPPRLHQNETHVEACDSATAVCPTFVRWRTSRRASPRSARRLAARPSCYPRRGSRSPQPCGRHTCCKSPPTSTSDSTRAPRSVSMTPVPGAGGGE